MTLTKQDKGRAVATRLHFTDSSGRSIPGVSLVDENGNQIGVTSSPLQTAVGGIPSGYSKSMKVGHNYNLVKGQLNKLRLRPGVLNEHVESSREALDIVDASTIVGQVFKASQNNIDSLLLTLQSADTFASMDAITSGAGENKAGTMEYSSDVALQAEYIKSGAVEAVRSAFTDSVGTTQSGSWALKVPCDTLADKWTATLTSTDLTGVTFSLAYANTKDWAKCKVYFFIGDGTNTKSFPLSINTKNVWQTFPILETAMTVTANDLTANTPDMTAITKMGFRIDDIDAGEFAYIDSITYQAPAGSISLKLWDCGSSLPTADGASFNLTNNATQITEIGDWGIDGAVVSTRTVQLLGGKRLYHVDDFAAGVALEHPNNDLLTIGNYYAITLHYVDTDVTVYGPDTTFSTDYYENGYAFYTANEGTNITKVPGAAGAGAYSDMMFGIISTQPVYILGYHLHFITTSGTLGPQGRDASWITIVEDSSMAFQYLNTIHGGHPITGGDYTESFEIKPVFMDIGGKFEVYYSDDPSDDIEEIELEIFYSYIPPTING